jgi:hypothetical protein
LFRSSGVQEFRSSGVQEFRSSGVQEFRSSGVIVDGPLESQTSRFAIASRKPDEENEDELKVRDTLVRIL